MSLQECSLEMKKSSVGSASHMSNNIVTRFSLFISRLPTRPVLQTPAVSIDLPMERKQQQSKQQCQKPTTGAATSRDATTSSSSSSASAAGQRSSDKKSRDSGANARRIKSDGSCFSSVRSPKRQYFTIHPEWVSENLSVSQMSLREKTQTYPPRRCKSAPPPRSRNPITWEY